MIGSLYQTVLHYLFVAGGSCWCFRECIGSVDILRTAFAVGGSTTHSSGLWEYDWFARMAVHILLSSEHWTTIQMQAIEPERCWVARLGFGVGASVAVWLAVCTSSLIRMWQFDRERPCSC